MTTWGEGGRVNLKRGLSPWATTYLSRGGPHVCADVVMAGGYLTDAPTRKEQPPGDVQAFDVRTGRPPILADLTVEGRATKAVVQLTKHGFAFVFDRLTGRPVWPIEERPVPTSDTPGEQTSPTQPFPTRPPPFERQGVSVDDLIDFTPELRAHALELAKQYRLGPLFTPPSIRTDTPGATRGTVQNPGSVGGADQQGGVFDPDTHLLYVSSITAPFVADILPGDPATTSFKYVPGLRAYPAGPQGLPLLKPPYGRITAIDLNEGSIRWMVPHGSGPRDHPVLKPLNLPPLGNPGRGGLVATKTLLFVGEGDPVVVRAGSRLPAGMPLSIAPGAGAGCFALWTRPLAPSSGTSSCRRAPPARRSPTWRTGSSSSSSQSGDWSIRPSSWP
ncbi:MAG: hypothetical protein AB7O28_09860 [Vicinamibacterales bacterium]